LIFSLPLFRRGCRFGNDYSGSDFFFSYRQNKIKENCFD
jgi:hypothetical protein